MGNVTLKDIVVKMNHNKFRFLNVNEDYSIKSISKVMTDVDSIYYTHKNKIHMKEVSWMTVDEENVVNIFWGI